MNLPNKRILCGILAAIMLFSTIPNVQAYTGVASWATEGVTAMDELGLIPASLMDADLSKQISRLDMSRIAVAAYEKLTGRSIALPETHPFPDTTDPDVEKAWVIGVIRGDNTGAAHPNNALTRLEFFIITHRFLEALSYPFTEADSADLSRFTDGAKVPSWGLKDTRRMVGLGVVNGAGDVLNFNATTSCQEGILMFYRAFKIAQTLYPEIPDEMIPEESVPEETVPEETIPEETIPEETVPEETIPEETEPEFEGDFTNLATWARDAVISMDDKGLIPYNVKASSMSGAITRLDMCKVMMRTYKYIQGVSSEELNTDAMPFKDTDDQDVRNAYSLGIVNGTGGGNFSPNAPITRQDFFVMAVRFLNALDYPKSDDLTVDLTRFADDQNLSGYAVGATRLLVGLKLVNGSENRLNPQNKIVSQEALVIFDRIYNFVDSWRASGGVYTELPLNQQIVKFAMNFLGYDYVYGKKNPEVGFDCSGFVHYVYKRFGYKVNSGSYNQWGDIGGTTYFGNDLQPGDVLFFSSNGKPSGIHHVGLYIGDGKMIHAANSKAGVIISSLSENYYAKRFIGGKRVLSK